MKSYNCFYSALFDVLYKRFGERAHLLINNRWQFFYNKSTLNYSDDFRIIGEYPLLFDQTNLQGLSIELGINVNIVKETSRINELKKYIERDGYVIIFANMQKLLNNKLAKFSTCVTSIMINEIGEKYVSYISYDNSVKNNIIEINKLEDSWNNASEHTSLKQCVVLISYDKQPNYEKIIQFFCNSFRNSIDTYTKRQQNNSYLVGSYGLREFAKDVKELWITNNEVLLDSIMYLEAVIRQRECVLSTIRKFIAFDYYEFEKDI